VGGQGREKGIEEMTGTEGSVHCYGTVSQRSDLWTFPGLCGENASLAKSTAN
jgi:hypothetical protein